MLLYAIDKVVGFDPGAPISSVDYDLFHGYAYREFPPQGILKNYRLGEPRDKPLLLRKDIRNIEKIFQPSINLVVDEEIKNHLSDVNNIDFMEVIFDNVFLSPVDKKQLKNVRLLLHDREEWFFRLVDNPILRDQIGRYFEFITPHIDDVGASFVDKKRVKFILKASYESHGCEVEDDLSSGVFKTYPVLQTYNALFFREDIFSRIERFINPVFFRIGKIRVK